MTWLRKVPIPSGSDCFSMTIYFPNENENLKVHDVDGSNAKSITTPIIFAAKKSRGTLFALEEVLTTAKIEAT